MWVWFITSTVIFINTNNNKKSEPLLCLHTGLSPTSLCAPSVFPAQHHHLPLLDPSRQTQLDNFPDSCICYMGSQGTKGCHTAQQPGRVASNEGLTQKSPPKNTLSPAIAPSHTSSLAGLLPATQRQKVKNFFTAGPNAATVGTKDGRAVPGCMS